MTRALVKDASAIQPINLLANGGMDFAQRIGTGSVALAADNSSAHYYLDRWHTYSGGNATSPTITRAQVSPTNSNLTKYCLQMAGTNASGANAFNAFQKIEASVARVVAGGSVSLSLWVYSDTHQNLFWTLSGLVSEDNWQGGNAGLVSGTVTVIPGGWQYVTVENIAVTTSAKNGMQLGLDLFGPNVTGTLATHRFAQVMLTPGPKAQTFVPFGGSYAADLRQCERYFQKSYALDVAPGVVTDAGAVFGSSSVHSNGNSYFPVGFRSPMRAISVPTVYDAGGGSSTTIGWQLNGVAQSAASSSAPSPYRGDRGFIWTITPGAGNAGKTVLAEFHWAADADVY